MGIESLLLIVVVVEAVWILSSLFRGADEEKRKVPPQRMGTRVGGNVGQQRPRPPAATNVDRFLEEVNRRRREAAEREAAARRQPVSPQAQPQRRRPSSAQPVRRDPVPSRRVVQPEPKAVAVPVVVMAEDAAMAAARALATPPPTPAPTPAPVVPELPAGYGEGPASRTVSPALAQMLPLLRDRKGLRSAILLQEVFGSPLCRRRGRARRGLG